eukprot:CAMPEP_0198142222 /NCGR_PEP_ID=MMETSP1443-20131203/5081_1 /TAXON_ID=186043 /ORGANISM="Entomoneis sp., Strain CCMP2396" /LENGTH=280 /DNA_ID=CAMNT_0043805191 /DNA_START=82 /DNA_END=921 /DNA_ORIENTATION=+
MSSGRCLIQSIFSTVPKSKPLRIRKETCRVQTKERFSTSVSESEVQKFNALHSEWWDPKKNPLIQMNTVRVQYIREQVAAQAFNTNTDDDEKLPVSPISPPFRGLKMLDVGCGGGVLSESLFRLGASEVTGIDPSKDLLRVAQQRAETLLATATNNQKPNYQCTTAEEWAVQRPQHYDVVCIMDVIEHIPQLDSVFSAISTLLKPNGILFVSTLNRTALSYALSIVGAEYVMGYVPVGTHDWNYYRSPSEVQDIFQPFSLQQSHIAGMVLRKPPLLTWDW